MSGALVGLVLGLGLACIWWSWWPRQESTTPRQRRRALAGLEDDLAVARVRGLTLPWLCFATVVVAVMVLALGYAVTAVMSVSLAFAMIAASLPFAIVRERARRRRALLRDVWPDVVDHVASAVRAGLALPEALVQLAERGPEQLREPFATFAHDYRATGRFSESLDLLKARLSDPVADRLIEALRIAREVGGSDLGRLLRALSTFLRDDARSRSELEARQSWTVNAARLAMGAPWIVLLLLATRGSSLQAYQSPGGVLVLVIGAAASLLAYRLMLRIGRLPQEQRVLR
ncbi:type II secretion system F family protein [soil metagenome]